MRTAECDKCHITAQIRNPEADGWTQRVLDLGRKDPYIDLCPGCSKAYYNVVAAAENTYKATIIAWLHETVDRSETHDNI